MDYTERVTRLLKAIDLSDPNMERNAGWFIKREEVGNALIAADFPYDDDFVTQVTGIINSCPVDPFESL